MPSVSRLFPAVFLAITAWLAADAYFQYMPEGTAIGNFREVCAAVGLIIGWFPVGRRIGESYRSGLESGLLGSTLIVFWSLLGFSIREMLSRSLDRRYTRGLGQAISDTFDIFVDYALRMLHFDFIVVLVVGGIFAGWAGQWASNRWK